MNVKFPDLAGQTFGRLLVLSRSGYRGSSRAWLCRCSCGATSVVRTGGLTSGNTRSCGSLHREAAAALARQQTTHGKSGKDTAWAVWLGMRQRCSDSKRANYRHYGGRGIRVCARWQTSFAAFLEDVGPRPSLEHSIDRINPNGDYEPGNCRWATRAEQYANRRPMAPERRVAMHRKAWRTRRRNAQLAATALELVSALFPDYDRTRILDLFAAQKDAPHDQADAERLRIKRGGR